RMVEVLRRAGLRVSGVDPRRPGHVRQHREDFLTASAFYVCYIVAGVLAHPDWKAAAFATVTRPEAAGIRNYGHLYTVIALVGTTIAPWMQFYLQASVVEKGVTAKQYRAARWDVIIGCVFTDVVAWFIIVACAA